MAGLHPKLHNIVKLFAERMFQFQKISNAGRNVKGHRTVVANNHFMYIVVSLGE